MTDTWHRGLRKGDLFGMGLEVSVHNLGSVDCSPVMRQDFTMSKAAQKTSKKQRKKGP